MRTSTILSICALVLLPVGCKQDENTESPTAQVVPAPKDNGAAEDDEDPNQARVSVDPRIAEMCGISEPTFEFDSSKLGRSAKTTLDKLAECFATGAAKDENLSLVGHADPRGSEDYNFALGQRRAGSVAGYLDKRGLSGPRVATSSRGELDAVGTEERSWRGDRRVEILLAR